MKRVSNNGMFKGATPGHFELAKVLRNNMTPAEEKLWNMLSNKKFHGLKFRRQHPIAGFILDFYCHSLKLAIEIDGKIHLKPEVKIVDEERQKIVEEMEIKIIRFTNEQINDDLNLVLSELETIVNLLRKGNDRLSPL